MRIAAAYALANGAVNQKQKLKDRAAARLAREQAEQNGAAEGLSGTQGKALADSSRAAASAAAVSAVLTSTTEPQPYRVNLEFYRSPDATSFSDGGAPTVGGPGSASMPGAVSGAPGNAQATSGAGNAPGAPQAGTAPEMAAAGAAAGAAAALGTGRGGTAPAAGTGPGTAAQPEASSGVAGASRSIEGDYANAEPEALSSRSGSWLGWLGWSRGGDGAAPEIEQQPAEQGRADGQAAPHAEAAVGAFVKGKSEGGSGSAGSSPKRMETPRPVVSPGGLPYARHISSGILCPLIHSLTLPHTVLKGLSLARELSGHGVQSVLNKPSHDLAIMQCDVHRLIVQQHTSLKAAFFRAYQRTGAEHSQSGNMQALVDGGVVLICRGRHRHAADARSGAGQTAHGRLQHHDRQQPAQQRERGGHQRGRLAQQLFRRLAIIFLFRRRASLQSCPQVTFLSRIPAMHIMIQVFAVVIRVMKVACRMNFFLQMQLFSI